MTTPIGEVICDVRELPAPEPMHQVMKAIDHLEIGMYVRMMHRMEPYPLYKVLEDMGFEHRLYLEGVAPYEVMIFRSGDYLAKERLVAAYGVE